MPTIQNSKGESFDVSDVDAVNMTKADPSLKIVGDVATSNDAGDAPVSVAGGQAVTQEGVAAATAHEQAAYAHKKALESQTSTLGAAARGVLSIPTFGLTDKFFGDEIGEADAVHHGLARHIGEGIGLLGTVGLGNDLGLSRLAGGGTAEGDAARALATSSDALTAEHVGAGLPVNALVGADAGNASARALGRSGSSLTDSRAAHAAIAGVPEDLAGLDSAGLRDAAATERASLKTAADAERASLEEARVPQRQQLADEIKDLHSALADEAPISKAVQGADVAKIEGIKDARVQLAKSYGSMRSALDSPLSVARDPSSLIRPLEMRQVALEQIQAKLPELGEVLAGDARGAALRHVDDALVETKQQIARIRDLSPKNPVSSAKLTDLTSGVSPRLKAIEAAQDALKNAPEKGWLQKTAEGGAFGGGTALAHMIPGVGIAAPFVGKYAAESVGRLFSRLAEHGAASAAGTAESARAFLDVSGKALKATAFVPSKALAAVRFAPGAAEHTGKETMPELFKARSAEIRSQTMFAPDGSVQMRPEARAAMAKRLDPIAAVNPLLADKIESLGARKIAYISSKVPRKPEADGLQIGPDTWRPSDMQMASWARTIHAVENPDLVERHLAAGYLTPEEGEAYRAVYPERFAALHQQLMQAAPTLARTIPYARRLAWSTFAGVPIDASMAPNVLAVLQGTFTRPAPDTTADIPGMQAPKIKPSFGSLGSMKSLDKPTPAQNRASRG